MTMKLAAAAASIVLALASSASAQPGMTEPGPAPAPAPVPVPSGGQLSESTALALSLGGTVVSWGLMIGSAQIASNNQQIASALHLVGGFGVIAAPGFGHWYAGKYLTRGLGLRALGLTTVFVGALVAFSECPLFSDSPCDPTSGAAIALGGVGLFIAGTVDDIVTAPGRVRRHNARVAGIALAPVLTQHSAGFALGGRF